MSTSDHVLTGTRLAFVTQWFPPEPTPLPAWIAAAMRARGADVHVVTGVPNYPSGVVAPGYSARTASRDDRDGLRVTRAPLVPSHSRSTAGRAANYLSFAASSAWTGRAVLRSADVALVYGSPVTAALAAQVWGTPYVVMVQDLWPDSVTATGFLSSPGAERLLEETVGRYSRRVYQGAAHVCAITPGVVDVLVARGVDPARISVVHNWVDETVMRPVPRDPQLRRAWGAADDDLVLLYAGTMGPAQDLRTLVDAMALLRGRRDVHLVLVGEGIEREPLRARAAELGLVRVTLHDPVPASDIPGLIAAADLNVVPLADQPLFRITLPSKVQATLACGGAVLAVAPGDAARIVHDAGAGAVVAPGDPSVVAEAVAAVADGPRELLAGWRSAARAYYLRNLSETINADRLAHVLAIAARQEGRRRG